MRRVSKKRAKLMRAAGPVRREFLEWARLCWLCGRANECVHEMAKGSHRDAALDKRLAWFSACSACNQGPLEDQGEYPLARQLAFKKFWDPEHYDLEAFNELRGRAPGAITEAEVDVWINAWGNPR